MNKNASVAQALNDLTTDRNLLARDLKIAQQRIAELEAEVKRLEKELEPLEGRSALDHMRYQAHLETKVERQARALQEIASAADFIPADDIAGHLPRIAKAALEPPTGEGK